MSSPGDAEVSEKTPLLVDEEKGMVVPEQPVKKPSLLSRVKIHPITIIGKFCNNGDISPAFGEHIEIALRTVVMVLFFVSFQLDPGLETRPWAKWPVLKLISPLALVMLFFSLGKTLGETVDNVWNGMAGTTIATLAIWVMFGVFPGGYHGKDCPDSVFWIGLVAGVLFVVTTLWVNMDTNTKIFALCNWVWFWMDFLDHGSENTKNQGFLFDFEGSFMLAWTRCALGCGLAIVVALLPYPILAQSKAKQIATTVASDACTVWEDATQSYWGDAGGAVYECDRLLSEINSLQNTLVTMGSANATSWWECLGMGSVGRSREYLDLLAATLVENLDYLPCVLKACAKNAKESSEKQVADHRRVASIVLPPINQVVATTAVLLKLCVMVSCDGNVDDDERARLAKHIEEVNDAIRALRLNVHNQRPNTGTSELRFDVDYLDEYTFLFCVSHFGRCTANFAQKILDMQGQPHLDKQPSLMAKILAVPANKVTSIFDPSVLKDPETLRFVLRNGAGILVAFCLGYRGYPVRLLGLSSTDSNRLLPPLSAGAASTLTLMLTKFTGSAMQNTLSKIMGIILGMVAGMMMVGAFGQQLVPLLVVLSLWVGGTVFMYFHSATGAGTFLLMCIFGVSNMLQRCPPEGCKWDSRKIHAMNPIIDCMFALFVMLVVDLLLRPKSAAEQAGDMLSLTWSQLSDKVNHLFDQDKSNTHSKQGHIPAQIASCKALGHEAVTEPHYWKVPWKGALYGRVLVGIEDLRSSILMMNTTADESCEHGNTKMTYFVKACEVPEFRAVHLKLQERMKMQGSLLPLFTYESQSRFPPLSDPSNTKANFATQVDRLIDTYVDLVNQKGNEWMLTEDEEVSHEVIPTSLETDPICKLSCLMFSLTSLMEDMRQMEHDIMRST